MAFKNNRISGNSVPICFLSRLLRVLENSLTSGQGKLSQKPSVTSGKNVSRNQKKPDMASLQFLTCCRIPSPFIAPFIAAFIA